MRTTALAIAAALLTTVSASAASLPLDGAYGSTETCRLFERGGVDAVYGLSNGRDVLMTPNLIVSQEMLIEEFRVAGISSYTAINDDDMNGQFTMKVELLPSEPGSLTVQLDDQPPMTLIKCQ